MSRINVLFLIDQIACGEAGTEQHLSFLLRSLPEEIIGKHLAVIEDTGYRDAELFPVQPSELLGKWRHYPGKLLSALRPLCGLMRREKIDIIHTFFPGSETLALLSRSLVGHRPLAASRRNMGYWQTPASLLKTRLQNRFIDVFLANCAAVGDYVTKREGVPPGKVRVIPNPVPSDKIREGLEKGWPAGLPAIAPREKVVGIVATVRPVKDHETFVRAAGMILAKKRDVRFVIVGRLEEEYGKRVRALVGSLGLMDRLIWTGPVGNPVGIMGRFDVGVLCSRSEGLSNSLIEYAALGIPAVATDVGGSAEVVRENETGFLVPPGSPEILADRVADLLDDGEKRRRMGEAAARHARSRFAEEKIVRAYVDFYLDLGRSDRKVELPECVRESGPSPRRGGAAVP